MLIKKQFDEAGGVARVHVKHTGTKREQNFSHRLVAQAVSDGWMKIEGDTLTVKADPEDLVYRLARQPGYYCSSNGERIPISEMAWAQKQSQPQAHLARREALAWLADNGKAETDYEVTNAYECVLADQLHDKFRAVAGPKGQIVAAHKLQQEG